MSKFINANTRHLINEYALIYTAMNAVILDHEELGEAMEVAKLYPLTLRRMEGRVNPAFVRQCVQMVTNPAVS